MGRAQCMDPKVDPSARVDEEKPAADRCASCLEFAHPAILRFFKPLGWLCRTCEAEIVWWGGRRSTGP